MPDRVLLTRARELVDQLDFPAAQQLLRDQLTRAHQDPADADPLEADTAALYAGVLLHLGEPHAARVWAAYAHTAAQRLHGEHDRRTLHALGVLACTLHRVGSSGRATGHYQQLVAALSQVDGHDGDRTLAARADAAVVEHARGMCAAARGQLTEVIATHQVRHGPRHPVGIRMNIKLAGMWRDCGDFDRAHHLLALARSHATGLAGADVQRLLAAASRSAADQRHLCGVERDPAVQPAAPLPPTAQSTPAADNAPYDEEPVIFPLLAPAATGAGAEPPEAPSPEAPSPDIPSPEIPSPDIPSAAVPSAAPAPAADWPEDEIFERPVQPGPARPLPRPRSAAAPVAAAPVIPRLTQRPSPHPAAPPHPAALPYPAALPRQRGPVAGPDRGLPVRRTGSAGSRGSRRGIGLALVAGGAVVAAGVALGGALIISSHRGSNTAGTGSPAGTPGPAASAAGPSAAGPSDAPSRPSGPAAELRLVDQGDRIRITWAYPETADAPVILSAAPAGEPMRPLQSLPAGTESVTLPGLDPKRDYCVTVTLAYRADQMVMASPVCTDRRRRSPTPG